MNKIYQVYQVSDSTGETLDRIFLAVKAQFTDFNCKTIHYSFTRTENQVDKIISKCGLEKNVIILYTIVDKNIAKYIDVGVLLVLLIPTKTTSDFSKSVIIFPSS